MNPLAFTLLVSVMLNLALGGLLQSANRKVGEARTDVAQARAASAQCDAEVQTLQETAKTRTAEAETARKEAQRLARVHRGRGDLILSTPPARPGDDCGSAQLRLDSWWGQRR